MIPALSLIIWAYCTVRMIETLNEERPAIVKWAAGIALVLMFLGFISIQLSSVQTP